MEAKIQDASKDDDNDADDKGEDGKGYTKDTEVYALKRHQNIIHCEVFAADPVVLTYLKWLESPITFDRKDRPDYFPRPGQYLLVVDPIIGKKRLAQLTIR